jgi:threonine dehydratase
MNPLPTAEDILEAHHRIRPYIHRTPVMSCAAIDGRAGCQVFFKCENFQKIGAFKMRGASNAVFSTPPAERTKGFATHSSGNHAQAVAKAAAMAGTNAYIVMPDNSSRVKLGAVRGYGAEVTLCEPNEHARQSTCDAIVQRTGAQFVHPFDDYRIIAGQATAALELLQDIPDLDAILAPVGGGGLAAGTALSAKYFGRNTRVYLTEPEAVDDTFRSFRSGKIEPAIPNPTLADGLRTTVGQRNFDIIKTHVEDVFTVTENELVDAMKLVWERMKIVIEPSAAVPVAALLKNKNLFSGKSVGIILSGGNVDLSQLPFQHG